jgi:hypothetical protein
VYFAEEMRCSSRFCTVVSLLGRAFLRLVPAESLSDTLAVIGCFYHYNYNGAPANTAAGKTKAKNSRNGLVNFPEVCYDDVVKSTHSELSERQKPTQGARKMKNER